MKPTWGKVVSAALLSVLLGSAMADVGEARPGGVYDKWLPFSVVWILGGAWSLGYWSRKGDE